MADSGHVEPPEAALNHVSKKTSARFSHTISEDCTDLNAVRKKRLCALDTPRQGLSAQQLTHPNVTDEHGDEDEEISGSKMDSGGDIKNPPYAKRKKEGPGHRPEWVTSHMERLAKPQTIAEVASVLFNDLAARCTKCGTSLGAEGAPCPFCETIGLLTPSIRNLFEGRSGSASQRSEEHLQPFASSINRKNDWDFLTLGAENKIPPDGEAMEPILPALADMLANFRQNDWKNEDDTKLLTLRQMGRDWSEIQWEALPHKSTTELQIRHKQLSERHGNDSGDRDFERLTKEYMKMRREIWRPLAERLGMKWDVVEMQCMGDRLEIIQSRYAR
ncbi:hypothetical protein V8F06_013324 [Rhypophila decipiens]